MINNGDYFCGEEDDDEINVVNVKQKKHLALNILIDIIFFTNINIIIFMDCATFPKCPLDLINSGLRDLIKCFMYIRHQTPLIGIMIMVTMA